MRVEPLTGGQANTVFAVTVGNGERVVLRLHPRRDGFAGTRDTITTLKALGLPVPVVRGAGVGQAFSWLVLDWRAGQELRWALPTLGPQEQTRIAQRIVGFQRRVGTLPLGEGFGYVPPGTTGTYPTWRALLGEPAIPRHLAAYLDRVRPTCFLDDITGKNVIVDGGALTGLIDLDHVCYGDPLHWLALTRVGLVCDVGMAGDFYAAELERLWNPTSLERRALAFYCVGIADDFLTWYGDTEDAAWRARMSMVRDRWHQEAWQ